MADIKVLEYRKKRGHGLLAESLLSRRIGGRVTAGSGNKGEKGDIAFKDFQIESKATINSSLGVKIDWLHKIYREALELGKRPALAIQFVNKEGKPVKNGSWVMVRETDFKMLMESRDGEYKV